MNKIEYTRNLLNSFDLATLPRMGLADRKDFPQVECVYIARKGVDVLYVGRTNNLKRRWYDHHRIKELVDMGDVYVQWLDCTGLSVDMKKLEEGAIVRLSPTMNNSRLTDKNIDEAIAIIKAHGGFSLYYGDMQVV